MNIDKWLKEHKAISLHWIENTLSLSSGTIRKGRTIPIQYIKAIEDILKDYGYNANTKTDIPNNTIIAQQCNNKVYVIVKGIIKEKRLDTGWLIPSSDFPDNSEVNISIVK
jgi:hypothetical protein